MTTDPRFKVASSKNLLKEEKSPKWEGHQKEENRITLMRHLSMMHREKESHSYSGFIGKGVCLFSQ